MNQIFELPEEILKLCVSDRKTYLFRLSKKEGFLGGWWPVPGFGIAKFCNEDILLVPYQFIDSGQPPLRLKKKRHLI